MKITKEEMAKRLDGCEYGSEFSAEDRRLAARSNLVVVYGYSDDTAELEGAIIDEIGCYGGGRLHFDKEGIVSECECSCIHYERAFQESKEVKAVWDKDGYSWMYETDIPHATFDVFEDKEKYCRGIIFSLDELS